MGALEILFIIYYYTHSHHLLKKLLSTVLFMAVMDVCLMKPLPDQSFSVVCVLSIAGESCFYHASHYNDLRRLQSAVCDLLSIVNGVC